MLNFLNNKEFLYTFKRHSKYQKHLELLFFKIQGLFEIHKSFVTCKCSVTIYMMLKTKL
jgi:hypothetical protein